MVIPGSIPALRYCMRCILAVMWWNMKMSNSGGKVITGKKPKMLWLWLMIRRFLVMVPLMLITYGYGRLNLLGILTYAILTKAIISKRWKIKIIPKISRKCYIRMTPPQWVENYASVKNISLFRLPYKILSAAI